MAQDISAGSAAIIRPCAPGDAAALSLVGRATFLEAYAGILPAADILAHSERAHSVQVYQQWLQRADMQLWLLEAQPGNAPVGYLVLGPPDLPLADIDGNDYEIKRIYLLHRFQGQGLGRQLMEAARAQAGTRGGRRLLLGVYSRNHAALAFYARLGYQPVGTRTFHVGDSDYHDLILALPLAQ